MIGPKGSKPTPAEERRAYAEATERDGDTCQRCRRGGGVTSRHHRKGRGVGGLTVTENLLVLCGTGTTGCHGFVTGNPERAVLDGWSVPAWADPLHFPAARWVPTSVGTYRQAWVLYRGTSWVEISEGEAAVRREGIWAA